MRENAIVLFRCPSCGGKLRLDRSSENENVIQTGSFLCLTCAGAYEVKDGVAVFLLPEANKEVNQVQYSYSEKWTRVPEIYNEGSFATKHQHEWYITRYHWGAVTALGDFLKTKKTILDAGCGLGRDIRWYASLNPDSAVVGADLSTGAFIAYEKSNSYRNLSVIQANLNKLPFAPDTFDFVACDQVLPCVEDPLASVRFLWSLVKPGGHFAFYVYKEKCPIREFSDDFLRGTITKLSAADAWEACTNITLLGKALSDLGVDFDLPRDIPELKIKAGRYNLQRFLYYNVLKCFWNDEMSFDENNLVNFDWFHPAYTYRHSVEEVESWIHELGMKVLVLDREDPSGISVLAQKI